MIEGLKPYAEYKDTGAPWFGTVPEHWNVGRLGAVFGERGETNERREVTDILSVMKDRGVIPYAEKGRVGNKASDDVGRYKIVRPDDLVVNCMNVIIGSVGRSRYTGCLSPVYYVLKRRKAENDPSFLALMFQHKQFQQSLVRIGNGILAHRMRIPMEKLKAEMFPLPPPDEQALIVRFLHHANWKIDGFMRAKRKLVGLLNEQKQAIIHRAVTRGLDPNVPIKPSGIPWLGDIPTHWDVLRAKYVFREMDERSKTGNEEQLSVSHITGVTPRSQKNITMFKAKSYVGHKICRPGDLAVNTMWAWMAALGVSKHEGIISPAYAVYRQRKPEQLVCDYADYMLRIAPYKLNYLLWSTGLRPSRLRLYPDEFFKIPIIIPPKDEQQQIVHSIAAETSALNIAIARTNREMVLMQEYRTRLTADVVTGKLDVRDAARNLPEAIPDVPLLAGDGEFDEVEEEEAA
jgi:type I restriction enzyme S subunit